ncbi:hypothetical protein DEO72_LG2g2879 [Vigna unguiculata]|uniref:Uncharacterized protein n=1 Tax=Vigna unguiculata TaxID=3917 RepID=A0A4D6L224_VIGUN|nr:hypothetical protein DEO72_LG2g2879 [Vigna unguiculata]
MAVGLDRQAIVAATVGTGTSAPSGEASPARRDLQRGCFQRRYTPGDTCHPLGGLEAAAPGDTCLSLGDFATTAFDCWFCIRDLQGF